MFSRTFQSLIHLTDPDFFPYTLNFLCIAFLIPASIGHSAWNSYTHRQGSRPPSLHYITSDCNVSRPNHDDLRHLHDDERGKSFDIQPFTSLPA